MTVLELRTSEGVTFAVPATLGAITTYVFLEQERWFEKEIEFLRRWLRPGMTIIDIGANLGAYSLPIARLVGPMGRVFAYEPGSEARALLERSRALNAAANLEVLPFALSDREREGRLVFGASSELNALGDDPSGEAVRITSLDKEDAARGWTSPDFVKIDAEGEEERILAGAGRFFARYSPLVMFEIKAGLQTNEGVRSRLLNLGYRLFRQLGGEPVLVSANVEGETDPFELNLFAARPDLVDALRQQGLLVHAVADWKPGQDDRANARSFWRGQGFSSVIGAAAGREPSDPDYDDGLVGYAVWRDVTVPLPMRVAALKFALQKVRTACARNPTVTRLSTLARVASEWGARGESVKALECLLRELQSRPIDLAEPFWPACGRFDGVEVAGRPVTWFAAAAVEQFELSGSFSSVYSGGAPLLAWLCDQPFAVSEMLRRRVLIDAHAGDKSVVPPRLASAAPDHVNAALWSAGAVPGTTGVDGTTETTDIPMAQNESPDQYIRRLFAAALDWIDGRQWKAAERLLRAVLLIKPSSLPTLANLSVTQYEQNKFNEAALTAQEVLHGDRNNAEALLMLSTCQLKQKMYHESLATSNRIIALNPRMPDPYLNCSYVLSRLKRYPEALIKIDQALSLDPRNTMALANRGGVLRHLARHAEALAAYDKTLELQPGLADAWLGRGDVLSDMKRHADADAAYERALTIKPDLEAAWLGRGNALHQIERHDEALLVFDRALSQKPNFAEAWFGRGNALYELRRFEDALSAYDRALAMKPDLAEAWLGRGNVFYEFGRYDDAFEAYGRALSLRRDFAEAWLGQGNLHREFKRHDEALAAYDRALALKADLDSAWLGRGHVFADLRRYSDAIAAYDKAFRLKPDLIGLEGARLHARMNAADWTDFEMEAARLVSSIREGKGSTAPFSLLSVAQSSADQLAAAKTWVALHHPAAPRPLWTGNVYPHDRVRVGYVSTDFRDHPVAYLMAGVFERHDRSRFRTYAISLGPDDSSELRTRLRGAFDEFIDVRARTDGEIARLLRDLELDIVVDLMGHTKGARPSIFAARAVPIQVNYLGFAGTTGADYVDYLIADATVIPPSRQQDYTERIVYLPHSFLPHDDASRIISNRPMRRHEFGLPDGGVVFCCFNNAYKFNPLVFQAWIRILKAVGGSVLWFSALDTMAAANLRREAAAAGVDTDRLVFAKRLASSADHLARHRLADLFLDTLPYNAHTTASDALWAGLPILTQAGETFAGRVAASLLTAIGAPELITHTQDEYEELAVELATNPERLAAIRSRIAKNRLTSPLFATPLFTRHLEAAYTAMVKRYRTGQPPEHLRIADPALQ